MWHIIFAIPNLGLQESVGTEHIAIARHDDRRVMEITSSNPLAKLLVEGFEDPFRRKVYPSLLIVSGSAPSCVREIDAIVGFRNCFALCTIIKGHEHSLTSSFVAYPLYSDYFDFYAISISKNNDGFITNSPSLMGFDFDVEDF